MMKPTIRLLVPIISRQDFDIFCGLPAEALLARGNLPALSVLAVPEFCLLTTSATAHEANQSERIRALAKHIDVRVVTIDELVLDYSFEVIPSLAYMKGMVTAGDVTNTSFVFFQHNLVLADGALSSIARRIARGAQVLTATYFRADAPGFIDRRESIQDFAPRPLLGRAMKNFNINEIANVLNSKRDFFSPTGRVYWKCDASTLVSRDLHPSLLALRPSCSVAEAPGFRDVAFAEILCPGISAEHFDDSDEFLGIELTYFTQDSSPRLSPSRPAKMGHDLTSQTTASQRAGALDHYTVFHVQDVPTTVSRAVKKSRAYVEAIVAAMKRPQPALDHPYWRLAFYLWAVRRFELRGGLLPQSPFATLFAHSEQANVAAGRSPGGGGLDFLMTFLRKLRKALFGQAPIVSMLHPYWLDFRHIAPDLRAAVHRRSEAQLYLSDDAAPILGHVLGAPAFSTLELLKDSWDVGRPKDGTIELVILELSSATLSSWRRMFDKIAPSVKTGGRIVLFHRNSALAPLPGVAITLGVLELTWKESTPVVVSVTNNSRYRSWLLSGYPVALDYIRQRRFCSVVKGGVLFAALTAATVVLNALSAWFPNYEEPTNRYESPDAWTSVTIAISL